MPSGLPLKWEVSFLLVQAEIASLRRQHGRKSLPCCQLRAAIRLNLSVRPLMQLSAHQTDEAQLTQLGLEATALIRAGDLAAAVARFGYALAQEREPSVALQEDLADCLAQLGAGALAPDQPIATIVRYLAENDSGLFAAVEC